MLANQITRLANPEEADLLIEIRNVFFAIITLVSSANIAGPCWKLCEMFISEKILIFVSFTGWSLYGPWEILPKVRRCRFRPLIDLFTSREKILLLSAGVDILQTRTQETVNVRYAVGNLNKFVTLSLKSRWTKDSGEVMGRSIVLSSSRLVWKCSQPYITRNHKISNKYWTWANFMYLLLALRAARYCILTVEIGMTSVSKQSVFTRLERMCWESNHWSQTK